MCHFSFAGFISLSLLASTAIAASTPVFDQDGWSGFKRKEDIYNGCIMGKHITKGIYFLVYANASKAFSIGVSSSTLDKDIDEEIAGTVTFDDDEPIILTGTVIEPDVALFFTHIEGGFEPLLRKSRQLRLNYDHSKLGLPLKGSNHTIDLLWDCAEKTSQEAEDQFKQDNKDLVQKVLTGTIGLGTLDSGINGPEGSYGFMTRSPEGDKIFQACKMDDNCKITALVKPGTEFIQSVISVENTNEAKPEIVKKPEPKQSSQQERRPTEILFLTRGNWGVSIVNAGGGVPYCTAWNFSSARYIQNIPQVQDEMQKAMASCVQHITENPDIFTKPAN